MEVPHFGGFVVENTIKMDDNWGYPHWPPFQETSKWEYQLCGYLGHYDGTLMRFNIPWAVVADMVRLLQVP